MHIPYQHQCGYLPDFVVTYQLFPLNLDGDLPIVYQGRRWDFMYDEKLYRDGFLAYIPKFSLRRQVKFFHRNSQFLHTAWQLCELPTPDFDLFISNVQALVSVVIGWQPTTKSRHVKWFEL